MTWQTVASRAESERATSSGNVREVDVDTISNLDLDGIRMLLLALNGRSAKAAVSNGHLEPLLGILDPIRRENSDTLFASAVDVIEGGALTLEVSGRVIGGADVTLDGPLKVVVVFEDHFELLFEIENCQPTPWIGTMPGRHDTGRFHTVPL